MQLILSVHMDWMSLETLFAVLILEIMTQGWIINASEGQRRKGGGSVKETGEDRLKEKCKWIGGNKKEEN